MESEIPKFLIVSYYFPPFKRVGGRRWAKHAKFFNKKGIDFKVLTGRYDGDSPWDSDIAEFKNKIERVELVIPKIPYHNRVIPTLFIGKLRWRLSKKYWKLRNNLKYGNHYDVSGASVKNFSRAASKIIKKDKINIVLLSVGPFRYSKIIISLKKEFPDVKFVLDYRDGWGDGPSRLSQRKQHQELKLEKKILDAVDACFAVNGDIINHLKSKNKSIKTFVVPHCVDEEYLNIKSAEVVSSALNSMNIVYGGQLYEGMDHEIENFVKFVNLYNKTVEKNISARLYVPYLSYKKLLNKSNDIELHQMLKYDSYVDVLMKSDCIVLFRPAWSKNAFSSKFFEIICTGKPILYFGGQGKVSEFLVKNNLGIHIENIQSDTIDKFKLKIDDSSFPNTSYNFEQHSFRRETDKILNILQELLN